MIDKATLLQRRLPQEVVEIEGLGEVLLCSLSRAQVLEIARLEGADFERALIVRGLVDPQLSEDEVAEWMALVPPAEIETVTAKITELTRLVGGAVKAAIKRVPGGPDATE